MRMKGEAEVTVTIDLDEIDEDVLKEYITDNYTPDEVFDEDVLKEYITDNYTPDEVFDEKELADWAEENGYVKTEEEA